MIGETLKVHILKAMIESTPVKLAVNPKRGVDLPEFLMEEEQVIVRIGLNLKPVMEYLIIDETGVFSDLSFNGGKHDCRFSWNSIEAFISEVDNEVIAFADPALLYKHNWSAPDFPEEVKKLRKKAAGPHLRLV